MRSCLEKRRLDTHGPYHDNGSLMAVTQRFCETVMIPCGWKCPHTTGRASCATGVGTALGFNANTVLCVHPPPGRSLPPLAQSPAQGLPNSP